MSNLAIEFCGVKFKNPLVLASGILGITSSSWKNVVKNGAGGVTTKSIWMREHKGHPNPTMIANEHYMLNAVGLPDAGMGKAREEIGSFLKTETAPLIVSIVAGNITDFGLLAEEISKLKPQLVEVNISCPNVESELGKPFACVAADAAKVTRLVKKGVKKIPISVKLSPNVENIVTIAKAVADAGADAVTLINSVGPGMAINIEARMPVLANKSGGLTGPAIKPIAVKMVYDVKKALPHLPIIGIGGITTGRDAIEIMMAGATLVGIGSGVYYRGVSIFKQVTDEMQAWCKANKVKNLADIIGAAHQPAHK